MEEISPLSGVCEIFLFKLSFLFYNDFFFIFFFYVYSLSQQLLDFVFFLENFSYPDCVKVYLYFPLIFLLFQFVHFFPVFFSAKQVGQLCIKNLVKLVCLHYFSFQNNPEVTDQCESDYSDLVISRKALNWGRDKEGIVLEKKRNQRRVKGRQKAINPWHQVLLWTPLIMT